MQPNWTWPNLQNYIIIININIINIVVVIIIIITLIIYSDEVSVI